MELTALRRFSQVGRWSYASNLIRASETSGLLPDLTVLNILLSTLPSSQWSKLCHLFDRSRSKWSLVPDVVSYCAAITTSRGRKPQVEKLLLEMCQAQLCPDLPLLVAHAECQDSGGMSESLRSVSASVNEILRKSSKIKDHQLQKSDPESRGKTADVLPFQEAIMMRPAGGQVPVAWRNQGPVLVSGLRNYGPPPSPSAPAQSAEAMRGYPISPQPMQGGGTPCRGRRVKQDGAQRLDPLVLLRKCATTGQHVQYDYEHLVFGHYRVHKNTKCAFRPSKAEPFMDIGSIWYMYHEVSREDGSYHAKAARQRGFQYIGVIDRSDLLAYIEGSDQHFEKIVPEVLDGSKLPKTEKVGETPMAPRKRGGEEIHLFEAKRRRQDSVEISFKEYAMQARPLSDLASAVRRRGKPVAGIKPVLQLACDELKEWSKVTNIPTPKPPREKRPFAHYLNKFIQQDPQKLPIILVPNNKSAPVNKNNARGF
eukprot:symbB.v1.2.037342.t1/scaffold5487.1/size26618/1